MSFWEFQATCEGFENFHGMSATAEGAAGAPSVEEFLAATGRA